MGLIDLTTVSDADLFGEVARRRESERQAAALRDQLSAKTVFEQLLVLLLLVPQHSKQSCNDLLPLHPIECSRCTLVRIKQEGKSNYAIDTLSFKPLP